jgi:cytochrome P450
VGDTSEYTYQYVLIIHTQDSKLFPNPSNFEPERWLGKEHLDRYLVAFGKGTRNCIGQNLGEAEIYITLAHTVMTFDMELLETDMSDVQMTRDWYVPQLRLDTAGVRFRLVGKLRDV